MKTEDLIQEVRASLGLTGAPNDELDAAIIAAHYPALEELARIVAADDKLRRYLVKTFTVTSAAGVAPLADALGAAEPLLLEFINKASLYVEGLEFPLAPAPDKGFQLLEAGGRASYAVVKSDLSVKGPAGWHDGDVTIENAPYLPLLGSIISPLSSLLVGIVAGKLATAGAGTRARNPLTTQP